MQHYNPFSGLVLGRLGQWISPKSGSHHVSDYTRWIGCRHRIGIELEFNQSLIYTFNEANPKAPLNLNRQVLELLNKSYVEEFNKLNSTKKNVPHQIKLSHAREIQVLWDTANPIIFRNCVLAFGRALQKHGLNMLGSVHVNTQIQERKLFPEGWGNMHPHSDCEGSTPSNTIERIENKFGPSSLSPEELLAKLLVVTAYFGNHAERAMRLARALDRDLTKKLPIMVGTCEQYLRAMIQYHRWRQPE